MTKKEIEEGFKLLGLATDADRQFFLQNPTNESVSNSYVIVEARDNSAGVK